jgi:hypothetical protein
LRLKPEALGDPRNAPWVSTTGGRAAEIGRTGDAATTTEEKGVTRAFKADVVELPEG